MLENQQVECFELPRRLDDLERKKEVIEGDQSEPAKDLPMVKSIFSLEHKCSEWMNSSMYLDQLRLGPFIESSKWVYLLGATNIVGDVWT